MITEKFETFPLIIQYKALQLHTLENYNFAIGFLLTYVSIYTYTHIYMHYYKLECQEKRDLHISHFSYDFSRNETVGIICTSNKNWTDLNSDPLDRHNNHLSSPFPHQHFSLLPKSFCPKNIWLGHLLSLPSTNPSSSYTVPWGY